MFTLINLTIILTTTIIMLQADLHSVSYIGNDIAWILRLEPTLAALGLEAGVRPG